MKIFYIFIVFTIFNIHAAYEDNLSPNQVNELLQGKIIKKELPLKKSNLPEFIFISLTNLTPLEAIAVFSAYDHQKNYIPNLKESKPIKEISPTDILTYYRLNMPWPFNDSIYTHGAKISKSLNGEHKISWYMVKSNVTKKVHGYAKFIPFKKKTMFVYHSSVWPSSFLAGMLKNTIRKDTLKSYIAILDEFDKLKKYSPHILETFKKRIINALDNKSVYKNIINKNSNL